MDIRQGAKSKSSPSAGCNWFCDADDIHKNLFPSGLRIFLAQEKIFFFRRITLDTPSSFAKKFTCLWQRLRRPGLRRDMPSAKDKEANCAKDVAPRICIRAKELIKARFKGEVSSQGEFTFPPVFSLETAVGVHSFSVSLPVAVFSVTSD